MVAAFAYEMGLTLKEIVRLDEGDVTFSDKPVLNPHLHIDSLLTVLVDQKGDTSRPNGFLALPPVRAEIIGYTDLLGQFKGVNETQDNPAFIVDRGGNRIPDASAGNLGSSLEKYAPRAKIRGFSYMALRRGYLLGRDGKI